MEIKQYAEGWITERAGTDVPRFLKAAFLVIALGCLAYFLLYMTGETTHTERGALVRQMNAATRTPEVLMYAVAAILVVFGIVVAAFSLRKFHED